MNKEKLVSLPGNSKSKSKHFPPTYTKIDLSDNTEKSRDQNESKSQSLEKPIVDCLTVSTENKIYGVSRFKNIDGISCYIVSILHIIQQIKSFTNFITTDIDFTKFLNSPITYQLYKLIKASLENENIRIGPKSFKKSIAKKNSRWGEMEHQDSQEFYNFLISTIEEECGQKQQMMKSIFDENKGDPILKTIAYNYITTSESKDYSPMKDIFIGYLISNIKCASCNAKSPNFESFVTLPLSIPIKKGTNINSVYGLEECLDNFITDEELSEDNKIICDICGIKNQSIKKIQIWKPPQILVIQLKRFVTNSFGQQTAKILNPVVYPVENFDISYYIHQDSPYKTQKNIYNLLGVNVHQEIGFGSINHGHYVSIIKNNTDNEWYLFDDADELVKVEKESIQNRNAYLLFYLKI